MISQRRKNNFKYLNLSVAPIWAAAFIFMASTNFCYASNSNAIEIPPQIEQTTQDYDLKGFRGTFFDMSEQEVIQSIEDDFGYTTDLLKEEIHPLSKTKIISLVYANLIPNTGPAQISYVFGYESKKLIQINISWNESKFLTEKEILKISALLQNHLMGLGFAQDKIETAIPLNPSDLILFRGEDVDKNLAILVIHGLDSKKKTAPNTPMELTLSFQKDSINPDIYKEE